MLSELASAARSDYNGQSQQFRQENAVACPYFMPIAKLAGSWPHPARLPLGCGWSGHCTAPGHEQAVPSQDVMETFCNLGYASSCGWAPAERRWDAVRFAVAAPAKVSRELNTTSAERSSGRILRLNYVCEQANRPADHGELEFDLSTATWLRPHEDGRIQKMAECFVESYLSKRT